MAGWSGNWRIASIETRRGAPLAAADRLDVRPIGAGTVEAQGGAAVWTLAGTASNVRYAERREITELRSRQAPLGRDEARRAALIPIRKSAAWWELAQDERRAIFEETSHHTRIGMEYLPAVALQLYHCRDLGEPFDFLTWFEYAAEDAAAFEDLVRRLRETAEWTYVDREVDIRLVRPA
jgi:chlorite dismutase